MKKHPRIILSYDKTKRRPFALMVNGKTMQYGLRKSVTWVINTIRDGGFTAAFGGPPYTERAF